MKKRFLIIIIILFSLGCKSQVKKEEDKLEPKLKIVEKIELKLSDFKFKSDNQLTYRQIKSSIRRELNLVNETDSLSNLFYKSLVHRIFPRWESTLWSFEGHTSIPRQGEIACGYFVSTTLRDIGINLNRYKLAQQLPINEAKSLALNGKIITISEINYENRIQRINEKIQNGIHFIGFGKGHVGFILKHKGELYLIHSNYMGDQMVELEKIEESEVFQSFEEIHLVELSTNQELLNCWKKGIEIKIIM